MVRQGKFRHNIVVTGSNDGTKQVSKDAWNDDLDELGMFGHGTVTTLVISSGDITPLNDMHKIDGESASNDFLDNILVLFDITMTGNIYQYLFSFLLLQFLITLDLVLH